MPRRSILGIVATALLAAGITPAPLGAAGPSPEAVEFFEKRIRPVLVEHCYRCHSARAKTPKGGLRVDGRDFLLKGGDSGPALTPGQPEKSRLIEAVTYKNTDLQMPPKGKLPDAVVTDLETWVRSGAPWPKDVPAATVKNDEFDLEKRKREHWAWRPVTPVPPPAVKDAAWPCTPADRFILAKLEEKGLRPAPPADRRTLLRRLSFDLTGLPPSPAEIDAFLKDDSPEAYARVVDWLLQSPHFGERWARHWLDLVRYAETKGHEFDHPIPNAYHYRDYVIRALNADVPYNQFVIEHIAGDLLDRPRLNPADGSNESILGTAFWFLGEEVHSPVDIRQDQADRFDNRIDVLTKTFLGLTVSCARCHDHKFDPISQKDYYALFGLLEGSSYRLVPFDSLEANRRAAADLARLRARASTEVRRVLAEAAQPTAARLADYLLAARSALLGGDDERRLAATARSSGLDAGLLREWLVAIRRATADPNDPLHAWAKIAADSRADDSKHLADLLRPIIAELRRGKEGAKQGDVVVDYASAGADQWLPDGFAYGPAPARPGDVRLSGDAAAPRVRFVERCAAEYDRVWDVLKLTPGTQNDPGALGQLPLRAGRTIRTATFRLTAGKLHYLVKGEGAAYVAVGAHTMIAGPLHGQLVTRFGASREFRWVAHDLTPYRGYLTHVEFTPAPGSDFAVAMVVQSEQAPAPILPARPELLRLLTDDARSPATLAAGYARLFADAVRPGAEPTPERAQVAQWLADHPQLLADGGQKLTATVAALRAEEQKVVGKLLAESRLVPAMLDGNGVDEHVFIRGNPRAPGELVPRRFLEALVGNRPLAPARGSGRRELAHQVADPTVNPFVARVLVNRVWHHLFGRGLVASVDNFGALGEPPTHPELLDYLADRFVRDGWSVKKLIRELVLSSTYRMSSQSSAQAVQVDPQNLLLHHARLRRLEGEAIRDAILAVSGRLNATMGGPPVPIHLTPFLDGRGKPPSGPLDGDGRRSIYLGVRRNFLSPLLLAFDTPSPFSTVGRRTTSNVPAQALILLNDPFVHQQAGVWARRVLSRPGTTADRVREMYVSAFGRPPTGEELSACLTFLQQQARRYGVAADDVKVWADLAHTLFNVKEFIFLG